MVLENSHEINNLAFIVVIPMICTIFIVSLLAIPQTSNFFSKIYKIKNSNLVSILVWINPLVFAQFLNIFNCESLQLFGNLLLVTQTNFSQLISYFDIKVVLQNTLCLWNSIILSVYCINQISNQNSQFQTKKNRILKILMILLDPTNVGFIILEQINKRTKINKYLNQQKLASPNIKQRFFNNINYLTIIVVLAIILFTPFQSYYQKIMFPKTFSPQKNIVWMFYGHMFNRYLTYYQFTFLTFKLFASLPLAFLKIGYHIKIIIAFAINSYLSYRCDSIKILMIAVLGTSLYNTYLSLLKFKQKKKSFKQPKLLKTQSGRDKTFEAIQNMLILFKTLTIVCCTGATFFFFVYYRLVQVYLTSFMINIGHVFLFGCIPWILIMILFVQTISIQQKINQNISLLQQQVNWKQRIYLLIKNKAQVEAKDKGQQEIRISGST